MSSKSTRPPPPPQNGYRWAGPGASWPEPRKVTPCSGTIQLEPSLSSRTKRPGAGKPRVNLVWHTQSNLRIHDHEPLAKAHLGEYPVIHFHCFDKFWFGKTRHGGFPKTGVLRAQFWRECVRDLAFSLEARGQRLHVSHMQSTADALRGLLRHVDVHQVFAYTEICREELEVEKSVLGVLQTHATEAGRTVLFTRCWGYTMWHVEDLEAHDVARHIVPALGFAKFRELIKAVPVREPGHEWAMSESLEHGNNLALRPPPDDLLNSSDTDFWGELPSLEQLGFSQEEMRVTTRDKELSQFPWIGGERPALARLSDYLETRYGLRQYVGTTDWSASSKCTASVDQTTKLSPWLAFGCLSPRLVYHEVMRAVGHKPLNRTGAVDHFPQGAREDCTGARGLLHSLRWRDYFRFIVYFAWGDRLFHLFGPNNCGSAGWAKRGNKTCGSTVTAIFEGHAAPTKWCCEHYRSHFNGSDPRLWPWGQVKMGATHRSRNQELLGKYVRGQTGYPFVDAAMRELEQTGYLHHLSREVVGWFFVRDLRLDWRLAAEWFESCLVDYDCVLNWGNWVHFILSQLPGQSSNHGNDYAGRPQFVVPHYPKCLATSQAVDWAEAHDPQSVYIRKFVPELRDIVALSDAEVRQPWTISSLSLAEVGLGEESEQGWACEMCTLINRRARTVCEACDWKRPALRVCPRSDGQRKYYYLAPLVPPPPPPTGDIDSGGSGDHMFFPETEFLCATCAKVKCGNYDDEGAFHCADCWRQYVDADSKNGCWRSFTSESRLRDAINLLCSGHGRRTLPAGIHSESVWSCVPDRARPVGQSGLTPLQSSIVAASNAGGPTPSNSKLSSDSKTTIKKRRWKNKEPDDC